MIFPNVYIYETCNTVFTFYRSQHKEQGGMKGNTETLGFPYAHLVSDGRQLLDLLASVKEMPMAWGGGTDSFSFDLGFFFYSLSAVEWCLLSDCI